MIQLEGQLEPAWKKELSSLGVELIKYVPDDSYIAHFENAVPENVRALGYVRYVGPFRADQKIHPRLASAGRSAAKTAAQTASPIAVNIMLSPAATEAEIVSVKNILSAVTHETRLRQGIILRGDILPGQLDTLAQSGAVLWIENAPKRKLVDETASKIVGGDDGAVATRTLTQQQGFDGSGVVVCVADTGLDTGNTNTMHVDLRGRVTGFSFYGLADGADGYGHGTHCAGIVAGNAATGETDPDSGAWYGLGVAPGAKIYVERIFDENATPVSPFPADETMTHDAVRHGAHIGSNSWGNDVQGEYDTDAAQFDELVRDADAGTPGDQPYILEFSSGNAGPDSQTVGSPATGKNVLTTGASQNFPGTLAANYGLYADGPDAMADFSSRGPCEDGRIKPDVVAPGTWIASLASSAAPNLASVAWSPIDDFYIFMGGTSMSGPHASGAAAIFVQFYKSTHTNTMPSPALVKAALINSADELDQLNGGPSAIPNHDEGWGRITLPNIITTNVNAAARFYEYVNQTTLLQNAQIYERHALVQSSGEPLKITLAYTDVPGFPGAIPALVNDLDLEVVGPDGTLYRGNQFSGGDSVPNAPSADALNNVEAVHILQPVPGDYLVRVRASHIVQDARLDTAAIDQDFALVVSGDLSRPGVGKILLNRAGYTAPSTIQLTVLDPARAASNTVSVIVTNLTLHTGLAKILNAQGNYGAFTGAVATVTGAAGAGQIQIANGNLLEADYVDSGSVKRSATAVADLVAPVLTSVTATLDLGVVTIGWQSSEAATSIVRYGTNAGAINLASTNLALTSSHALRLGNLIPGKTYYFYVVSADAAGNFGTNNNSGAYFTFTGVATPTVLLVDDYDSVGESDVGTFVIPDSSYTNALAAAGYSFGFWKVNVRGYPQPADLQPFPVVMWRTTDDIINYEGTNNTLTAAQQLMIKNYLNGGGSFLMASMGILTQIGNVSFRKEILNIGGFKPNPDPPAPCAECDEDFEVPAIFGVPGDAISSGVGLTLDYANYPTFDFEDIIYGPDFSDTFTPAGGASPIVYELNSAKPCGLSFPRVGTDSPGRVVFFSFPLDTIPAAGGAPNNEAAVLKKALKFLTPGAGGAGTIVLDNDVFSVPDQVTVEVADSDVIGAAAPQVVFTNSATTNKTTVTLKPTVRPGLFRGYLTLVTTNAVTNQLVAHNGNIITAKFFDASNGSNVTATARIDTVAPVISQVSATTGVQSATIRWVTTEASGSLVQYGESALLEHTANADGFTTNHLVAIDGLVANRNYFYNVISRDDAGNTAVDDNHGTNYSFSTMPALRPPWSDNFESGGAGWTVVPDNSSFPTEVNWSLGKPNNSLETSAHTGTNCWGSNLTNRPVSFIASSFLFSPFIDLTGFSSVTLTYWTSYDLTSPLESGQLGVSTSSSQTPASIPTIVSYTGDATSGWEQQTVDLSAYVGKTIRLVWFYQGVTIGTPLKGWLVDDVSLTGVLGGGTIVVTKNLGQGNFSLTGPFSQTSSAATALTFSNQPPGAYTVQFSDVAFYQTPADATKILTNGTTQTFTGSYNFIDVNTNGISDAWENYYFDTTSTNRTRLTDSDGDGMTDYAEFIAGTNPTNAASKLVFLAELVQTNRAVKLQWAAVPGRLYQMESATGNFGSWTPQTDWLPASGSPMTFIATNATAAARLFRVQVRP